jgi:hypothetical protein
MVIYFSNENKLRRALALLLFASVFSSVQQRESEGEREKESVLCECCVSVVFQNLQYMLHVTCVGHRGWSDWHVRITTTALRNLLGRLASMRS